MNQWLGWVARRLRMVADRLDHAGAPKATSWSFTFEEGIGIAFRQDGRGCRLWYLGDTEYEKAHSQSGAPPAYRKE